MVTVTLAKRAARHVEYGQQVYAMTIDVSWIT